MVENLTKPESCDVRASFVDPRADFGDWSRVEGYFADLQSRPLNSVESIERWLLDASELQAALDEERNVREVAMTAQTDDPQRRQRYLDFIENVAPRARTAFNRLDRKLLDAPDHARLPAPRYHVLLRQVRNRVEIFRDENVPLQTRDDKLRQRFQEITGAMTVEIDGREQTLEEAARYLDLPNREKRRDAWEKIWQRRLRDRDALDALFDEMIALRHRIALNAGFRD